MASSFSIEAADKWKAICSTEVAITRDAPSV